LTRWKRATVAAALLSASLALLANQASAHVWDRPRLFAAHLLATHLFAAPSIDPSFPSDHAAAAFAIAIAVFAFSRVVDPRSSPPRR
jgi:undecaprenyl-diphosphatase